MIDLYREKLVTSGVGRTSKLSITRAREYGSIVRKTFHIDVAKVMRNAKPNPQTYCWMTNFPSDYFSFCDYVAKDNIIEPSLRTALLENLMMVGGAGQQIREWL